jgi:pyruvate kinase
MIADKKTKIIATIGPSCAQEKMLEQMIISGMDAARLNFSHGSHQEHGNVIKAIRNIEKKTGRCIAIIADIQGPKIRLGNLPENGIEVKVGQEITIDTGTREFYNNKIPLPSLMFRDGTKAGHVVFIDDGVIQIKITNKRGGIFKAVVLRGGILFSKKGINVPELEVNSSILSVKDKSDIDFAVKAGADYIALSFLRNADDVKEAKRFLGKAKIKIIAKIERREALANIDSITDQADAVMVARGDLGIETPLWELPVRQKEIIDSVRAKMKPVIVATQMLDSMIRNPIPTRAEVSDVANAVFDSADAVMLSGETASGKYPLEAVSMMRKILEATDDHQSFPYEYFQQKFCLPNFLCAEKSIVEKAENSNAKAIIISIKEESLIKAVSHFRTKSHIISVNNDPYIARSLALVWGTTPLVFKGKNLAEEAKKLLTKEKFLMTGDKIICAHSDKTKDSGIEITSQKV